MVAGSATPLCWSLVRRSCGCGIWGSVRMVRTIRHGLLDADAIGDRAAIGAALAEAIKILTRRNYDLRLGVSQAGEVGKILRLLSIDRRAT